MGRTKKAKEIKINTDNLKAVITKDFQVLVVDAQTNNLIPEAKEYSKLDYSTVNYLFQEGEALTSEGGKYYELTKKLLERYCFYTMSYDRGMKLADEIKTEREKLNKDFKEKSYTVSDEHDLYYLSAFFLHERGATKKMIHYFDQEDNFERAAATARLIEEGILALRSSKVYDWEIEADILECCYLTPENKGIKEQLIMEALGLKRNRYFRLKSCGISHMAKYLFGSFPKERGYLSLDDLNWLNSSSKKKKKNIEQKKEKESEVPEIVEL